jgi:hypothetical protein
MPLVIENSGPAIASSDFWDSEYARKGYFYLSFNAGAARLLIPDSRIAQVEELQTGELVIISQGPGMGRKDMTEVLFEDNTDVPYSIHIGSEQVDRFLPASDHGRDVPFTAWGRNAVLLFERPGKFRRVKKIPCLEPWTK